MSLLLVKTLAERVAGWPFIVGIILLVLGAVFCACAGLMVKAIYKNKKVENDEAKLGQKTEEGKGVLIARISGLLASIVGLVLMLI